MTGPRKPRSAASSTLAWKSVWEASRRRPSSQTVAAAPSRVRRKAWPAAPRRRRAPCGGARRRGREGGVGGEGAQAVVPNGRGRAFPDQQDGVADDRIALVEPDG